MIYICILCHKTLGFLSDLNRKNKTIDICSSALFLNPQSQYLETSFHIITCLHNTVFIIKLAFSTQSVNEPDTNYSLMQFNLTHYSALAYINH